VLAAIDGGSGHNFVVLTRTSGTGAFNKSFVVRSNGNVGIGIENPAEALAVNGTVHAREVVVDNSGFPDYVFEDNYDLKPLSEVEKQIKAHKHLPGIPSAKDVAANGVNVGELQAKLLEKIEELTLHMIAQEKSLVDLRAQNDQLKAQIQKLSAQ